MLWQGFFKPYKNGKRHFIVNQATLCLTNELCAQADLTTWPNSDFLIKANAF